MNQLKRTAGSIYPAVLFFPLPVLLLSLLFSCSGSTPVIRSVDSRIILQEGIKPERVSESLSLSILASDDDGEDDLESLSVIHDNAELFWKVPQERWVRKQIQGESYIIVNGLIEPGGGPLPRGKYRLLLSDYSGSSAEFAFELEGKRLTKNDMPALRRENDNLVLAGGNGDSFLLLVSATGTLLAAHPLGQGPNPVGPILSLPGVRSGTKSLYVYEYSAVSDSAAFVAGPYEASELLFSR